MSERSINYLEQMGLHGEQVWEGGVSEIGIKDMWGGHTEFKLRERRVAVCRSLNPLGLIRLAVEGKSALGTV